MLLASFLAEHDAEISQELYPSVFAPNGLHKCLARMLGDLFLRRSSLKQVIDMAHQHRSSKLNLLQHQPPLALRIYRAHGVKTQKPSETLYR